jgi:hypothetical protein
MEKTTIAVLLGRADDTHYEVATSKNVFRGQYDTDSVLVTLSIALALYNSLEMVLLIATTFKRFRGLYFYSLSLCTVGVLLFAIGMMLGYFELCIMWLWKTILDIGWVMMIVFQALVLYSRLNLIYDDNRIVNAVKWMIVFTTFAFLVPVVVLDFGTTYGQSAGWSEGYYYIEQVQVTGITLQELIISGLYVWKTIGLLKIISRKHTRSMIYQLFIINVIIIGMDIVIICLQFLHYQLYQEALKVFFYSVKLKLELNILSKLVDLVHGGNQQRASMTLDVIDSNTITGQERDLVKAEQTVTSSSNRRFSAKSWFGSLHSDAKGPMEQINEERLSVDEKSQMPLSPLPAVLNGPTSTHGIPTSTKRSSSSGDDEMDEISPAMADSSISRPAPRFRSHRESDLMYADFLRETR